MQHSIIKNAPRILFARFATGVKSAQYVDTHTHLDMILRRSKLLFADLPKFHQTNFPSSFDACVTVACEPKSFDPVRQILNQNPNYFAAYGVHPCDCDFYTDEVEQQIVSHMASEPKIVAWGEMGLDYYHKSDTTTKAKQKTVFERQINMAIKLNKPMVIHARDADADTFEIMSNTIKNKDHPIHVHCFTSDVYFAKKLISHFSNLFIGVTGIVTFKTAHIVHEMVQEIPLQKLLLETDGPFLTPRPDNTPSLGICHPGHIPYIAQKIAQLKKIDVNSVYTQIRANTQKMYGI